MSLENLRASDPCVVPGVQPFLNELHTPISVQVHEYDDPRRVPVEDFIRNVFRHCYGARLDSFYPTLLAFSSDARLRAAVGVRGAVHGPLFAEQYLSAPAGTLIARRWGRHIDRARLVEVGNLALAGPGETRWVIAAVTTFLHARGYRWVLFTAVPALFNAFRRLGLNPIRLGTADPSCLPDHGRDWGSYYDEHPVVCVGDIQSGYRKLSGVAAHSRPLLYTLLGQAFARATEPRIGALVESAP